MGITSIIAGNPLFEGLLKRMNDENLIKVTTRSIAILDKKGLADLSRGARRLTGYLF